MSTDGTASLRSDRSATRLTSSAAHSSSHPPSTSSPARGGTAATGGGSTLPGTPPTGPPSYAQSSAGRGGGRAGGAGGGGGGGVSQARAPSVTASHSSVPSRSSYSGAGAGAGNPFWQPAMLPTICGEIDPLVLPLQLRIMPQVRALGSSCVGGFGRRRSRALNCCGVPKGCLFRRRCVLSVLCIVVIAGGRRWRQRAARAWARAPLPSAAHGPGRCASLTPVRALGLGLGLSRHGRCDKTAATAEGLGERRWLPCPLLVLLPAQAARTWWRCPARCQRRTRPREACGTCRPAPTSSACGWLGSAALAAAGPCRCAALACLGLG